MKVNQERLRFWELWSLIIVLCLAAFLRFWSQGDLSFFTYDQARDALYIKRIIVDHKLRLIGPQSSIPGVYTPPLYYYLMAPFLWLGRLDPSALDFATAIFGVLAVWGVFYFTRRYFGIRAAIFSSLLYAGAKQVVYQSRFAWNPNPLPLFTILLLIFLARYLEQKGVGWLFGAGLIFGIGINLHYSFVCLLPVFAWHWLGGVLSLVRSEDGSERGKQERDRSDFIRDAVLYILAAAVVVFLLSPLLLFDVRHGFLISRNAFKFFRFGAPGDEPLSLLRIFKNWAGYLYMIWRVLVGKKAWMTSVVLFLISVRAFRYWRIEQRRVAGRYKKGTGGGGEIYLLLFSILLVSTLVASLYSRRFFLFYLTFLYPIPFIMFAEMVSEFNKSKLFLLLILVWSVWLLGFDLKTQTFGPAGSINKDTRLKVAALIAGDVSGPDFNLAGMPRDKDRWDWNAVDYRYFVETYYNKRPFDWDPLDYRQARVLYFIDEQGIGDVLKVGTMEMSEFGPAKVAKSWDIGDGIIVYRLEKQI